MSKAARQSFERALAYRRAGQRENAYAACKELVARHPKHAQALGMLGALELQAGHWDAARAWLARAVELEPSSAAYLSNLGLAHYRLRALEEATEVLARAVKCDPTRSEAVLNLGLVLLDRGDPTRGLPCLTRAAQLKPDCVQIQLCLAKELARQNQVDAAMDRFHRVLALGEISANDCADLMLLLEPCDSPIAVEEVAREAIARDPGLARAHAGLGRALSRQKKFGEAVQALTRALELNPATPSGITNLGYALFKLGRLEEMLDHLTLAVANDPTRHVEHSSVVFLRAFSPNYDADEILAEARHWNELHARPLAPRRQPHPHDRTPERRLRIGYVSGDFRNHVAKHFIMPLFRHHDHERFEIIAYSSVTTPDAWTEQFKAEVDGFREVAALDDSALAELVRTDRVDILVDLVLHMAGSRLRAFAEKPAPVQISWLAYPGTTGVDAIDYRVTDPHLDPKGAPLPYSEHTLWLPHTFWCYDPLTDALSVDALPALSAGYLTFGCLNGFVKVNRGVLELWARVLGAVPGSRLLLRAPSGFARELASEVLGAGGIGPERVEFVEDQLHREYLATYNRIDVALDCVPYNGHTTSLDALWMGVPVVTLVGNTVAGRAGLSQAKNLGLDQLIATNADEFVAIAVRLANDLPHLATLRSELRARLVESPLMDAPRFARDLEAVYRAAWRHWCAE